MISKPKYYYKESKVKGKIYMQIWKKENNKHHYVMSLGPAEKLVKLLELKEQTNNICKIPTNFHEEKK